MSRAKREAGSEREELFDPASFPEDLTWVPAHHRLHPDDPVYLLLAWHWRRVKQSEDTIAAAILELRSMLDSRVIAVSKAAETVSAVNEALAGVQDALETKPEELAAQLDVLLAGPVNAAVERLQALEKSLLPVARSFEASRRRHTLATLLVGVALGVLGTFVLFGT